MNEKMKAICIMCPVGCALTIEKFGDSVLVQGNACPRGEQYGKDEITNPKRVLTTTILTNAGTASLKTKAPIPKKDIFETLKLIKGLPKKQYQLDEEIILDKQKEISVIVTGLFPKNP